MISEILIILSKRTKLTIAKTKIKDEHKIKQRIGRSSLKSDGHALSEPLPLGRIPGGNDATTIDGNKILDLTLDLPIISRVRSASYQ